jgi:hypothetical protein
MFDLVMIYRPFVDIEKSVRCLSEFDMPLIGKFQCTMAIQAMLDQLDGKESPLIANNRSLKFYWNNGKPFLADLLAYYDCALALWPGMGGSTEDVLCSERKRLKNCKWADNRSGWTEENANVHIFLLLARDHFWYQRFFCSEPTNYRYRQLNDSAFCDSNGNPRKLKTAKIMLETHEITRPN